MSSRPSVLALEAAVSSDRAQTRPVPGATRLAGHYAAFLQASPHAYDLDRCWEMTVGRLDGHRCPGTKTPCMDALDSVDRSGSKQAEVGAIAE
jgi:hypothetical protein